MKKVIIKGSKVKLQYQHQEYIGFVESIIPNGKFKVLIPKLGKFKEFLKGELTKIS